MIAILIFTVFFKLNKINLTSPSSSSTPNNTELDKKVEKKLTGMQIRLNEILTEISSATKEQKESISNMAITVKAAADAVASVAESSTANADTTSTITAASTIAIPSTISISSPTLTEPFASPVFITPNIIASRTYSAIFTNNQTRLISGIFDRPDDGHSHKSKFLDIDLDNDTLNTSNGESDSFVSKRQNQDDTVDTTVIHAITDAPSDMPDTVASSGPNSYRSINTHSRHHYYALAPNYLNNQRQDTDFAPSKSSSSSPFHDVEGTIRRIIDNNVNGDRAKDEVEEKEKETLFQDQNNNEVKDLEIKKLPSVSEKNSNPELDKIDKEILTALQRLGGIDESDDKDNRVTR